MNIKKRVLFRSSRGLTGGSAGFTLIELLVVIAIIGILAAVVLASVGSARTKGAEASVKTQMANIRSAAELYSANNTNSYAGVCTADSAAANPGVNTMITSAATAIGGTTVVIYNGTMGTNPPQVAEGATELVCADADGGWVAQAPLSAGNGYWCADSSGSSKPEVDVLPAAATSCT